MRLGVLPPMACYALGRYLAFQGVDERKAALWAKALGHSAGIGTREPTGHPAWVTQHVLSGGFAAGPLAGGDLQEWETAQAKQLGVGPTRREMNDFFLSAGGLSPGRPQMIFDATQIDPASNPCRINLCIDSQRDARLIAERPPYRRRNN